MGGNLAHILKTDIGWKRENISYDENGLFNMNKDYGNNYGDELK